jgi:hypothetical protein
VTERSLVSDSAVAARRVESAQQWRQQLHTQIHWCAVQHAIAHEDSETLLMSRAHRSDKHFISSFLAYLTVPLPLSDIPHRLHR